MNREDRKLFGLRLKALRKRAGCTQNEIAECLSDRRDDPTKGATQGGHRKKQDYVSKVERGILVLTEDEVVAITNKLPELAAKHQRQWTADSATDPFHLTFWEADPGKMAPSLLHQASAAYRALLYLESVTGDSTLFEAAERNDYYVYHAKWIPEYDDGLSRLRETVVSYLRANLPDDPVPVRTTAFKPEFDAIRWTSLAANRRVVYPFPFILTPRRRYDWFVLQYAWHRRIGIALHRDNPNLAQWKAMVKTDEAPTPSDANAWLDKLLDEIRTEDAHLYGVEGWIQQELIQLLVGRIENPLLREALPKFSSSLMSRDLHESFPLPDLKVFPGKAWRKYDAFIFDLADREAIEASTEPGEPYESLETIVYPHGIELPVGVGFTISMAPAILAPRPRKSPKNGKNSFFYPWQGLLGALQAEVFESVSPAGSGKSYADLFASIGIDVDHNLLDKSAIEHPRKKTKHRSKK